MGMSPGTLADTIHTAASHMRETHGPDHPRHLFWTRLAAWLDDEANDAEQPNRFGDAGVTFILSESFPLNVAEAYLDSLESTS